MKHRRNKVKREHGIIQDALTWLEELSRSPEVTDIIPGVIEVSRSPERGIVYKYETQTGCKILLKSNGSIQEAFVVTKSPDFVRQWVENRFPPVIDKQTHEKSEKQDVVKPRKERQRQSQSNNQTQKQKQYDQASVKSGSQSRKRPHRSSSKKASRLEVRLEKKYLDRGDEDSPNLGQRINPSTRQALNALQKNLSRQNTRRKK